MVFQLRAIGPQLSKRTSERWPQLNKLKMEKGNDLPDITAKR